MGCVCIIGSILADHLVCQPAKEESLYEAEVPGVAKDDEVYPGVTLALGVEGVNPFLPVVGQGEGIPVLLHFHWGHMGDFPHAFLRGKNIG